MRECARKYHKTIRYFVAHIIRNGSRNEITHLFKCKSLCVASTGRQPSYASCIIYLLCICVCAMCVQRFQCKIEIILTDANKWKLIAIHCLSKDGIFLVKPKEKKKRKSIYFSGDTSKKVQRIQIWASASAYNTVVFR